jgi:hypothetical protein
MLPIDTVYGFEVCYFLFIGIFCHECTAAAAHSWYDFGIGK